MAREDFMKEFDECGCLDNDKFSECEVEYVCGHCGAKFSELGIKPSEDSHFSFMDEDDADDIEDGVLECGVDCGCDEGYCAWEDANDNHMGFKFDTDESGCYCEGKGKSLFEEDELDMLNKSYKEKYGMFGGFNGDDIDRLIRKEERKESNRKLALFLGGIAVGAVIYRNYKQGRFDSLKNKDFTKFKDFKNVDVKDYLKGDIKTNIKNKVNNKVQSFAQTKVEDTLFEVIDKQVMPKVMEGLGKVADKANTLKQEGNLKSDEDVFNSLFDVKDTDKTAVKGVKKVASSLVDDKLSKISTTTYVLNEVAKGFEDKTKELEPVKEQLKDEFKEVFNTENKKEKYKRMGKVLGSIAKVVAEEASDLSNKVVDSQEEFKNLSDEEKSQKTKEIQKQVSQSISKNVSQKFAESMFDTTPEQLDKKINKFKSEVTTEDGSIDKDELNKKVESKVKSKIKSEDESDVFNEDGTVNTEEVKSKSKKVKDKVKSEIKSEDVKDDNQTQNDKEDKQSEPTVDSEVTEEDLSQLVKEFDKFNSEPKVIDGDDIK